MQQGSVDGAFSYYTADIEQKVRLLFLEQYSINQAYAQFIKEPYREILMLEAIENIIGEIESLSTVLGCKNQLWFWDMAQNLLKAKTKVGSDKLDAYIKIKKATLIHNPK